LLAHEFELEFAHANEFVNTYNGDGVKIVVSFSKTNLPDKDAERDQDDVWIIPSDHCG
jgi:hypothetical protein